MKVSEAYNSFMVYGRAERNYARETLVKHKDCFTCWILPYLGDLEVAAVTRQDILRLRSAMMDRGLGIARQYGVLMALKVFLKFCRLVLKIDCLNPNEEIKLPRRQEPFVVYLTNSEVERLRQAIPLNTFTGLRLRALVEIILNTGMRISEVLALDRTPFEHNEKEIVITGKGNKQRIVFLTQECRDWVRRFLVKRTDDEPAVFVTTGFPRRVDRADISKMFIRLRKDAGIDKPVTPHLLRHTFCTNLRDNGIDITLIKELAGHQDIQTTARYYLGVDKETLRKAVNDKLNYTAPQIGSGAHAPD